MTNSTKFSSQRLGDRQVDLKKLALAVLLLCAFLVFMRSSLELFLGPVMAVLMTVLYVSGYAPVVTALIIVANDALGAVFLGRLSFQYLLLALALFGLTRKRFVTRSEFVFLVIALVLQLELLAVGFIDFRSLLFSMIYVLAILAHPKNEDAMASFLRGVAIVVGLIALHACLTGGVEFIEYEDHVLVQRRGILGVGIGDPNFSCFLLNIGLVCTWCDKKIKKIWKLLLTAVMLGAMAITVSISGLLALILIIVLFFLLGKKKGKGVTALLLLFLVVALLLSIYISTPEELHITAIDNYISRVTEKLTALRQGDMNAVTTDRSSLYSDYLAYIFNQPILRFFFGGNKLVLINQMASHNAYVDVWLQAGLFGFAIVVGWILYKSKAAFTLPNTDDTKRSVLLLKALSLFVSFTLSISCGNIWSLWMLFLILL